MNKIGIAPKVKDFASNAFNTIDTWFSAVSLRFNIQQKAGLPVAAEIPTNQWAVFKDTSTGNLYLVANDNGTVKKVQLL